VIKTIYVQGTPHLVNVQRKYRTMWVAAGVFLGIRIEVKARSEAEVVAAWQRAAEACQRL